MTHTCHHETDLFTFANYSRFPDDQVFSPRQTDPNLVPFEGQCFLDQLHEQDEYYYELEHNTSACVLRSTWAGAGSPSHGPETNELIVITFPIGSKLRVEKQL